ncbi:MAG: SMC-Scp complex subunit ScpB [Eubacteriales bacterium]|nr:SMC-Scp complex subunit ScpB [Eubacteriales bacterium]
MSEEILENVIEENPADFLSTVEAVLFAMGAAVSVSELAKCAGCSNTTARRAARMLMAQYEEKNGGILIREFDGVFQMCSNPVFYDNLIKLVSQPKKPVLSDVVLETLAIIAYKAPTTKVDIEKIRGVSSDHAVNRLVEYGLVEEAGRLEAPGRPMLFKPTEEFYRRFGLKDRNDMPVLNPEIEAEINAEVEKEVREAIKVET